MHSREAQLILDDLFHAGDVISRVAAFETGLAGQYCRTADGSRREPDSLIMHARHVAVRMEDKGSIVFTVCSHDGVANVLTDARGRLAGTPLFGVLGGFHLSGVNERIIPQTVDAIRPFALKTIAAARCIGWGAVNALAAAFR